MAKRPLAESARADLAILQNGKSTSFDYTTLKADVRRRVESATDTIHDRVKRSFDNLLRIGKELAAVKQLLPHGQFGQWLKFEFGWTDRTARRAIAVFEQFAEVKTDNLSDLQIDPSAAYLLCESSVPDDLRDQVIERARSGERITLRPLRLAKELLNPDIPECAAADEPPPRELVAKDKVLLDLADQVERLAERYPQKDFDEFVEYLETLTKQQRARLRRAGSSHYS